MAQGYFSDPPAFKLYHVTQHKKTFLVSRQGKYWHSLITCFFMYADFIKSLNFRQVFDSLIFFFFFFWTHWKRLWSWEGLGAGGEGEDRDEMAGWHHWLDGHEFGWTPGDGDGQGSLACCNSWGRKESDMTEQLHGTEQRKIFRTSKWPQTLRFGHILEDRKCE